MSGAMSLSGGASSAQVNGGTLTIGSTLTISTKADAGKFTMSSGTLGVTGAVTVGRTGSIANANTTAITTGFVMSGGTANFASSFTIGTTNSSAGSILSGGALTVGGTIFIGAQTTATTRFNTFVVSGGTLNANSLVIAAGSGTIVQKGVAIFTGGTSTFSGVNFGVASSVAGQTGQLTLGGGTLYVGSGGIINAATTQANVTPTISLSSGTLGASADWSSSLPATIGASGITVQAADGATTAHNITLTGVLGGTGTLTKTGGGTVTLGGINTYSGTTTISAGTLALSSTGSINNSPTVNVVSGAVFDVSAISGGLSVPSGQTLKGTGTVNGGVTIASGATLAPGLSASPGVITFNNNLTLAGATTILINGTTLGSQYAGVSVGGNLGYGGALTLNFGAPSADGNTYSLFTVTGTKSGDFTSVVLTGSHSTSLTDTSNVWSGAADGLTFTFDDSTGVLDVLAAVPEPSSVAMLAGLAGLGFTVLVRRRRRQS